MATSLLRRTPVSSPVVLGDFEGNLRRWRYISSLSRNSSSVSSKPPLLTRVARSGPGTRLEEPVRTYIRSQIKVAFDWEIRIWDFEIELEIRVIRKRISPTRNPFSGWISIRKSKCGFHRLPFYRSIGKSEKGFAKLLSWTTVFFLDVLFANCACACKTAALKDSFSNQFFRISQSNGKNANPKTDIAISRTIADPKCGF